MAAIDAQVAARLRAVPTNPRRIHLIGIGGTAMAALAGMLLEQGYQVSGSDAALYEPTRSLLARLGIPAHEGYAAQNLASAPDLVIVGNVVTRANPEAVALMQRGLPYLSMPEALWHFFLRHRRPLMVCGTHGKTTSTSMLAQVLIAAGRDPSVLIGGLSRNLGANYRLGQGPDFVIEGDEYDSAFFDKRPKFIHYRPAGAILTSLEFDHADIYRDLDHVKQAFAAMVAAQEPEAVLVVCADQPDALEVSEGSRARRISYGLRDGEYRAAEIVPGATATRFDVMREGHALARGLSVPAWGLMNVANALGVYALLDAIGLARDEIAAGLASFAGVVRRQEVVGEVDGITVVDDFAHHPSAIAATLVAVGARFAGRRILAAFEPRSNTSRRSVFQNQFAQAFDGAARVYLAPVYFKENDPIAPDQRLEIDRLARDISRRGLRALACASNDEVLARIEEDVRSGDVVLVMSNGPFGNLKERLLEHLRGRARQSAI
jgi:UDP-N-acetylmuramate: L-alanyl-gamma-D-glutamyl-meso-diaminopimelate ligase